MNTHTNTHTHTLSLSLSLSLSFTHTHTHTQEMESQQLVDYVVYGNLRTKLHALLSCLQFDIGSDDVLSTTEHKKFILTKHYLDDKDATLWRAFSKGV